MKEKRVKKLKKKVIKNHQPFLIEKFLEGEEAEQDMQDFCEFTVKNSKISTSFSSFSKAW